MTTINRYVARSIARRRTRRSPDRYLAADEYVEFQTHHHPAVLLRPATPMAIALILALVGSFLSGPGALSVVLWLLTVPFILWFAWKVVEWGHERIVLTNQRIIYVTGLIVRKVAMMPFVKVTDLGYTRSVLGRLVGYGGVRLETAGQIQDLEHIYYLPDPDKFYRVLSTLVLGPKPSSEPSATDLALREIREVLLNGARHFGIPTP
jgi:membrane protein YdbS with pleckstrin-like domain